MLMLSAVVRCTEYIWIPRLGVLHVDAYQGLCCMAAIERDV